MDFNFFEPYAKVPEKTNYLKLGGYGVSFVILAYVVFMLVMALLEMQVTSSKIKEVERFNSDPQNMEVIAQYDVMVKGLEKKQNEEGLFTTFNNYVDIADVGRREAINPIFTNIISRTYVNSVNVSEGAVVISGHVMDPSVVGDLELSLRQVKEFSRVFVNEITMSENEKDDGTVEAYYNYTIQCTLDMSAVSGNPSIYDTTIGEEESEENLEGELAGEGTMDDSASGDTME